MRYYPLLLDLTNTHCLVVGAGPVGWRKIQGLLPCKPLQIMVVDPHSPSRDLKQLLARHENITYKQRPFEVQDLKMMRLVFACTSSRVTNDQIAQACAQQGILCNVTDQPQQGDVILPATISRGDLSISICTQGTSPALARIIRQDLERQYGPEYAILTKLLAQIRPALLALGWTSNDNRLIFRALAQSALPQLIKNNDWESCRELLRTLLPTDLHPWIGEWCDDCFQTI